MDEQGYAAFLRKNHRSDSTIRRNIECLQRFERYLAERGKSLGDAAPEDLVGFVEESRQKKAGVGLLGIADYCEWTGNEAIRWKSHALFAEECFEDYKVSEFQGIPAEYPPRLKALGIRTAKELLEAGRTPPLRRALAEQSSIPEECVLEMVKLADLGRAGGLKQIRGRLYYNAGFDTHAKIAAVEPDVLRARLAEYIQQSGFPGIQPTPKEALNAVHVARYIPRLVEY
jgi:hypothetical protein